MTKAPQNRWFVAYAQNTSVAAEDAASFLFKAVPDERAARVFASGILAKGQSILEVGTLVGEYPIQKIKAEMIHAWCEGKGTLIGA